MTQSGHQKCANLTRPNALRLLVFTIGRDVVRRRSYAAPRVHHALRRCGSGLAACGARAARERVRRIGVLMSRPRTTESQARIAALRGLQEAGWAVGRNMRIDTRWSGGEVARLRAMRSGIGRARPGRDLGRLGPTVPILQQATRTVPIVFAQASIRSAPASSRAWRGQAAT